MVTPLDLRVDAHSPIPIRRQLTEQLKHAIEAGGVPRDHPLPSIRELAGFLGINPNTVARVIEDLKLGGYVEARRGKGVFVAPVPPARPAPHLRDRLLQDVVIRAAALGMTPDDVAVGVLSVASTRPATLHEPIEVLLVECTPPELDFFARELEDQLPVHVHKVLLDDLPRAVRRKPATPWRAAVTSFSHLPEVERLLAARGIPTIALLAEAHLETLHQLAQLPMGTRVGVVSAAETAHSLEQSITNAGLPNVTLAGVCRAEGAALGRLVRRVDVIICSTQAADHVRTLVGSRVRVVIDDRALDPRAIEMLASVLLRPHEDGRATVPATSLARLHPGNRAPSVDGKRTTGPRGPRRITRNRVKENRS